MVVCASLSLPFGLYAATCPSTRLKKKKKGSIKHRSRDGFGGIFQRLASISFRLRQFLLGYFTYNYWDIVFLFYFILFYFYFYFFFDRIWPSFDTLWSVPSTVMDPVKPLAIEAPLSSHTPPPSSEVDYPLQLENNRFHEAWLNVEYATPSVEA